MESKQALLTALREEFDRWESLLESLSEEEIVARQLPSDLSIKDVIAHLHAWQELSGARLAAALNNRSPEFHVGPAGLDQDADENLERINAWIHDTNLDRPWSEVYRHWREGFLHFLDLAEAIPENELMEVGRYDWFEGYPLAAVLHGSYEHHHEEHYEPLSEWLRNRPG